VLDALLLLGVAFLVVLNGYFVLSEYALVRSRRGKLEALSDEGSKGAGMALGQLDEINEYISTAQVGVTFCSIGIGALGEPTIADLLEPVFGDVGGHAVAVTLAALIAYIVITSAHIVVGEIVPKVYAIDRAESIAPRVARGLNFFRVAFHPIIVVLTGVSDRILRALGVDPDRVAQDSSSAEDLKMLIAQSQVGGTLDPGEAGMLSGVFHLHEQQARQVMTPIPAVVTIDTSEDVQTALRRCVASGHTRLVVTEDGNTDRIKGLVHANSLARVLMNQGPDAPIDTIIKDAPIVPETKPLDDLLADLQRERASMAVVVDEYGRTEGIVTVEDIIEEVVGEITDETDPAGGAVRRLANGDWFVRGHVPITDLVDYAIELEADSETYNSVGGFVFGELGRLPKRGDMVRANGYSLRVEAVRENRVEAVRIRDHEPDSRNGRRRRESDEESVRDGG
jgi:CBS domain containing-hemolysin-like protein